MRSHKQSDSPSGYDREIRPRWSVYDTIAHQEQGVRRLERERWERKMQAAMPCEPAPLVEEFGTWVAL